MLRQKDQNRVIGSHLISEGPCNADWITGSQSSFLGMGRPLAVFEGLNLSQESLGATRLQPGV